MAGDTLNTGTLLGDSEIEEDTQGQRTQSTVEREASEIQRHVCPWRCDAISHLGHLGNPTQGKFERFEPFTQYARNSPSLGSNGRAFSYLSSVKRKKRNVQPERSWKLNGCQNFGTVLLAPQALLFRSVPRISHWSLHRDCQRPLLPKFESSWERKKRTPHNLRLRSQYQVCLHLETKTVSAPVCSVTREATNLDSEYD